jgi:metal-dependent amidase/aminoacylase/carboxypeptidase family protein
MERQGRTMQELPKGVGGGSTDMGNVSQVVPSIHPMVGVLGATGMPHTLDFAAETDTPAADDAIVVSAYGLACAVVDLATDPSAREEVLELQRNRPAGFTRRPAFAATQTIA